MYEVENMKIADRLMDTYQEAYEKRYRTKPIFSQSGSDQTILKDMARTLGEMRLLSLLKHYLKMDNEWFIKKGHDLPTFKSQINVVNSDFGIKSSKALPEGVHISVFHRCDNCLTHDTIIVPLNYNWSQKTLCNFCKGG